MSNPPSFQFFTADYIIWSSHFSLAKQGQLFRKAIRALETRDFRVLASFPFVGRIFVGGENRPHIPLNVRREVLSPGKCRKCSSVNQLTIDHIIPVAKGGTHDRSNLQCLCRPCNREKSDRTDWQ